MVLCLQNKAFEYTTRVVVSVVLHIRLQFLQRNTEVLFKDFVNRNCIIPDLRTDNALDAITQMVDRMCEAGVFEAEHSRDIFECLRKREELGSTAIGKNRFVPHCKTPHVSQTTGGIAICHEGFDAEAIDGQPVRVMFMLLAPPDNPGEHLRSLEHVSRQSSNVSFLEQLNRSSTVEDVWEALIESDDNYYGHRQNVETINC